MLLVRLPQIATMTPVVKSLRACSSAADISARFESWSLRTPLSENSRTEFLKLLILLNLPF